MENSERKPDSFDRALQAEATMSESEIKHLTREEDDNFRKVSHDECIYRFAVLFLQAAVSSPRDILTPITADKSITEMEKGYIKSFEAAITKESATLSPMVKSALVVAEKLEKEHLTRVDRVSKMLSKEDLTGATLCYPVTMWNLEKFCWRLLYHMGVDDIASLSQVVSRLSGKYDWVKQAYKRINMIPLVMLDYNRSYAWDVALSNMFSVPIPSSNQEREELRKRYKQQKRNYAGALAEVHFGKYDGFQSLPRHEVGDIVDELESAGQESMLNEIDHYSQRLKETLLFEQLPVDVPYLIIGLSDKCQKIIIEKSLYRRGGYRPREYVIQEVTYDPREALLADLIDEAREPGKTMQKLADREGIPVKELYEFKRRRIYREKKSR
ncbi:hypothetical protein ACFLUO_07010 [Chloroflexota bacterium]